MTRRKFVFLPVFILLVVLAGWLGGGTVVRADHNDNDFNVAGLCYSCHVLNTLLADPDTSFIRASTRTLDQMIAQNGGIAPQIFGCTFCHNDPTRTTYMQSAFASFEARPSQHPVDRGFSKDLFANVTLAANSYTTLYMSNWDNSWAKPGDQLNCIGCHEMAGSYPNHPRPDNVLRVNNPYMLRGGDSSWSPTDNHASNAFCLQVCHSGTGQGTSEYKMGHFGWGAYDNTTGGMPDDTLKEVNGTALKTSKCVDCHETHSANTKLNLMGEQRQSTRNIDAANCTAVCHNDADFVATGHGRPGINYTCANCHNSAVSHRDQSNPKRFSGAESPSKATLAQNFAANGRDDDFDGMIDDGDEATHQYSGESICSTLCHSDKHIHQGEIGGASGSASCLNCHDVHGHGVDNNAMMIRRTIMGKTTYYFTAATDYFRGDNNSICDNPSCHAKPLGNTATTGTILGDVQEHVDVNAGPGTNCGSCHNHSSDTGGPSFAPVCNSCHTYPGQTVLSGTHVLGGAHDKHVAQDNVGGYAFPCSACHYRYNHNQSNVQTASQWASNFQAGNVNIKFDGSWNPKNAGGPLYAGAVADNTLADNVYAPGVGGTGMCAGLYCHGNAATVPSWPAGSNTTPTWNNNATGACGTCHLATASNPPQTFAHRTHADNNLAAGYAISCRKCHYQTTSTGSTITGRGGHLNRESRVSFDATDPLVSSGIYGGTLTVGDSGSTTGNCTNIYCHSPGNRKAAAFDNGALGAPDWKQAGPLACNACHDAPPSYPGGSPKANAHPKHATTPAAFACQVCHWATTTSDNTIADRAKHANGEWDAVSEGDLAANPGATSRQQSHVFAYDNGAKTCNTAACHGGTAPVWGAAGPIACDVCHKNVAGAPAAADADDFGWDNGVMAKIRDSEWTTSGHGRTTGTYDSGRSAPGSGGTSTFPSCTTHCHTSGVSHNAAANPFRLTDKATPTPTTDFSDAVDPQNDNRVCLDCHSAPSTGSTLHVEQNHYGMKHGAQTLGGSFCWDCHDPHGDANDSMVQDNVTRVSDGVFGIPSAAGGSKALATFSKTNLNGETYNAVYDWGDYVDNSLPYRGICQVCHNDPPGASGGSTGGAEYFSPTRFAATHNKLVGVQGDRCTACHVHGADFAPTCNTCHGDSTPGGSAGMPPHAPAAGNQAWSSSVDSLSALDGVGNHRTATGIALSSHGALTCQQCHTSTPGSGATHNVAGQLNATMTNIATHTWYNGAAATWENGGTPGATVGVVDDSCSNIDCHAPYYNGNAAAAGTPMPYRRYWINATLWDCYTCHAYDGRTGVGARPRPAGPDNTMATGAHGRHVAASQMTCSRCHDVTGYSYTEFGGNHKNGFVNWSFAGAPNPAGYPAAPGNAYSVATGSAAPTDDNTAAGHRAWGTCSNIYCHSIVQTATGGPLTGAGGQYATASWDNATTGQCGSCHNDDPSTPGGTGVPMASGSHGRHLASGYAMTCNACHTGYGAGSATHADGIIEVPIGDNAWRVFTLAAAATIFDRAAVPGVDNANKTPGAAVGRCSSIPCHNDGRAVPGAPRVNPAVWGDAQDAAANCTYCHGGNRTTGAAMATDSHPKHVSEANLACGKCHAGTVATASDNAITAYDNHLNGVRNVAFPADVGGTYDNGTRTCSATYCHGTGASPAWGSGPIAGCSVCHRSQGAGTGTASFTGVHGAHADNTAGHRYRFACEVCHAWSATGHPVGSHAGGDDNTASGRTVDVKFTDNAMASWLYDGAAWTYKSFDLWTSPYGAAAPSPGYSDLVASAGTDSVNSLITWSAGTCANVYCHSNANPADAGGGANTYRTPAWDNAMPVTCTSCHLGPDTEGNMAYTPPTPDRMSYGHAWHLNTGSYAYSCDECHANTVPNDCTTKILDPGGFAYHVNGNKTDIQGSASVRLSTTVNDNMTYNASTHICSNVYCHSNGQRQTPPFVARNGSQTAQLAWNLAPTTSCGSANPCHASVNGYASGTFPTAGDNSAHTKHAYQCYACHDSTINDGGYDYTLHANGVKDVTIRSTGNVFDNDTIPNNNYDLPTKTCSGIVCHGGRPVSWTDNNLSCDACHTTVDGANVTADVDEFTFSALAPNMSKINPEHYADRGHGRDGALPWGIGKNPAALFGRPIACLDCHDNSTFHSAALFSTNPFRFRSTINGRTVALDNVDTVCYACHDSAAVKDHSSAVTGGGGGGWVHTQKCVDCHDVHGEGNIFMVHDNIVYQDNTTAGYATSNAYGVPYYPASRSAVVFTANTSGAGYASTDGAAPYDGICEVCHERTAQYQRTGALAGPQSHSTDRCANCHQHPVGFKASCNSCHGETTGAGSNGSPPYAPFAGNHAWPSRATVDNLSYLAGVGDHRTATGITASSHETFGCGQCHTTTPGTDPLHDNMTKVNASMDNIASHTWNGVGGPLAASWSAGPLAGAPLGGSVVDDSCSNIDCHSPYYSGNSFRSGTPFPYTRYWVNATLWDCYTCHAYDGFKATTRPGGTDNVIGTGSHRVHLGTAGTTPLRLNVSCAACHVDPGENVAHKDGAVQVPITGTVGGVTLGGSYSVTPAQAPTDNAAGHRAWGTCDTVYCHSTIQKNNPDGLPNDGVTYVPTPQWGSGGALVVCGSCHKVGMDAHSSGTDNIATGSHTAHVSVVTSRFAGISRCNACHQYTGRTGCSGCHSSHAGDTAMSFHSDGYIDIGFSGMLGTVNLSGGRFDNTDGSPDNTIIPGMPYGTCRTLYCHGTGTPSLTGGANQSATPNLPRWGDGATSLCGSCHGAPGATTNYPPATYAGTQNWPTSGAHAIHMDDTSMAGPRIGACTDCHTASPAATHVDGIVNFRARFDNTAAATLAATQTCDPCHGLGSAAAKANWLTAGALDCLTCHMDGSLANSRGDLSGVTAPNVGGDNATYGSYYTGHGRATGNYLGSGNIAANRACTDCHDLALRHINHVDDTTYPGNRLTATVPWNSGSTGGTVSGLCAVCHTTTASPRATKNKVNTHGNTGFSGDNHDPAAEGFAYNCDACHEPHGMTANGRGAGTYNIYMVRPSIEVRNFATPGTGADNTTTGPVYFESKAGAYSFDDNTSANANRVCVTCHENGSRPGSATPLSVAGSGGSHSGTPGGDYANDERGKDCSGCHAHDMDDDPATVDGLMPMACNDCHSYPGLDNTSPTLKQMSPAHGKHVGTPTNTTTNTKGYACALCHYSYNHNQSGIAKGGSWATFDPATVDIVFEPSWNPGSATYNGSPTPTGGNGGTGECGGLYCHGADATRSAAWGGSDNTPVWNQPSTAACGACHDTGTADTTSATVFSTKNHPVHVDNAARPWGPETWRLVGAGNCAEGTGCHTKYGLTPASTHANNSKDLRYTPTDNGEVARTLATTEVCRNCHTTYTSANIPVSGDAQVRTQANWDNPLYLADCLPCHNGTAAGTQARANIDGTGGRAAAIEGTIYTMGHGGGVMGLIMCGWCHGDIGHIGANRPVGSNPYRLAGYFFSPQCTPVSELGQIDYMCQYCHDMFGPADHTWRASGTGTSSSGVTYGPESKPPTGALTHPTTILAVGTDKDRWYQFPTSTHMPLFGDLLDSSYNRSSGTNNYVLCVTCHDPHGVAASPLDSAVRRFSGQNTDAKGNKALRFNYSTGTPTALCSQCHK